MLVLHLYDPLELQAGENNAITKERINIPRIIVDSGSIFYPKFLLCFLSKFARYRFQSSRLVAAACRDARCTLEGIKEKRHDARRGD